MRLADIGEVYGHFLIPYVDDEKIREALSKAVADSKEKYPGIQQWELTSIAGECDVLLHLFLSDFRVVADLQAEVTDSYSLASSWLYAIPYEESGALTLSDGELEFYIYLRVHRHFYKCYGASGERDIYEAVQKLLRDTGGEQLSGRVLYSLGWPDLIVHGRMTGDIQHLRRLIASLQSLSFPTAPAQGSELSEGSAPVFLKTITIMGLPMARAEGQDPPRSPGQDTKLSVPVLFGRSRPGLTAEAVGALRSVFERSGAKLVTSLAVNGTWDFMVISPTEDQISLERFHEAIRESREGFVRHGIERTQTHLLTSREADLEMLKGALVMLRPQAEGALLPDHCSCGREGFKGPRDLLERAERLGYLPRGLTRTISHVLSMFQHTLREPSNCCDAIGALRAHAQGLEVLLNLSLREHEFLERTPATSRESQALIANEISLINSHLAEWCKRAGRVVREKTSSSAARLFLQIDSIVAQRGAIPKVLMIAERIMADFYSLLPGDFPRLQAVRTKKNFAAILEPLGNVVSQPLMGLVAIPIRYAFALHLVAPQLWHEVGQYVFWAEYSPSQRARVDWELSRDVEGPGKTPSRLNAEAFVVDFHLRSDMFADLLVFCLGFGGSLPKFFRYLGSLTANVAEHDRIHLESWRRQALTLVHRLCFVAQFALLTRRAKKEAPTTRRAFGAWCRKVQSDLIGKGDKAEPPVRSIVDFLNKLSNSVGWPKDFNMPPNLASAVANNFQTEVYKRCLRDMEELAFAFRHLTLDGETARLDRADWKRIETGELVDLRSGEHLQAAYREFYLEELDTQLAGGGRSRREGQFRKMATLGRSALLHIYQSEAESP
jgi:hypothetical protein